ncbi:MAG: hypothetical protein AB7S71_02100 [Dongiaceae bacterium]
MKKTKIFLVFAALAFLLPKPAAAYLDPGTGTILLQALIASIAGGLAVIGLYWQKLKAALGIGHRRTATDDSETDQREP